MGLKPSVLAHTGLQTNLAYTFMRGQRMSVLPFPRAMMFWFTEFP